jgi:hypothetical protein
VECGRNTYRAAGDVVPGPAGAAATECFTRVDHEAWTEATRLTNRYTSGDYSFGESIAIDGVHIVVGTTDSNANGGTVDWYRNYGVFQRTLGEVGDGLNFGSPRGFPAGYKHGLDHGRSSGVGVSGILLVHRGRMFARDDVHSIRRGVVWTQRRHGRRDCRRGREWYEFTVWVRYYF